MPNASGEMLMVMPQQPQAQSVTQAIENESQSQHLMDMSAQMSQQVPAYVDHQ